jgi:steroid 5-alpha reductase family enzyme
MDPRPICLNAGLAALTFALFYGAGFLVAIGRRRIAVVDTLWGLSFTAVALLLLPQEPGARPALVLLTVAIWGLRLSIHLHRRNQGKPEEPRYAAMLAESGLSFSVFALRRVFLPQSVVGLVVSAPIIVAMATREPVRPLFWVGVAVWSLGFVLEAIGDAQLERFRSEPANRGRILDTGLWAWSRHPNYFGEATVWTGLWLMSVGNVAGWLAVVSPLILTYYLVARTGIAYLERAMAARRGPEYEEYRRRTSGFVPLPPKPRRG